VRQFEDFLRFLNSEVARGVENPQQRDAEIAGAAGASAFEAFEDGGEILLAEEADADRDVDLGVQHGFFFQALHEAVGDEFVVVGAAQVRADRLEGHEKTLEIGVAVESFDLGERGVVAVQLAQFEQGCGFDRALEMQVQFRLGELTDEGVGRADRYGSHLFDCSFLGEDLRGRAILGAAIRLGRQLIPRFA
jgi:hypothetical protein